MASPGEAIDLLDSDVEVEEQAAGSTWACSACTLLNQRQFLACDVCGAERPHRLHGGGTSAPDLAAAPSTNQHGAAGAPHPGANVWECRACTFENAPQAPECTVCGGAGPSIEAMAAQEVEALAAGAVAAAGGERRTPGGSARQLTHDSGEAGAMPAPGGLAGTQAAPAQANGVAAGEAAQAAAPALTGMFTLDCGCHFLASEAQQHVQQAAAVLPPTLQALSGHFRCPVEHCRRALTHRDLEALLGGQAASKVDRHVWAAAAAAAGAGAAGSPAAAAAAGSADLVDGGDGVVDLSASPTAAGEAAAAERPTQDATQQCGELAGLLLQLHGVLVAGKLPEQPCQNQGRSGEKAQLAGRGQRQRGPGQPGRRQSAHGKAAAPATPGAQAPTHPTAQQAAQQGQPGPAPPAGAQTHAQQAQQAQQTQQGAGPAAASAAAAAGSEASGSRSRRRGTATQQGRGAGGEQLAPAAKKLKPWQQPPPWAGPALPDGYGWQENPWASVPLPTLHSSHAAGHFEEPDHNAEWDDDEETGALLGAMMGALGALGAHHGALSEAVAGGGGGGGRQQGARPRGVGYGGGGRGMGSKQAKKLQEDAARRQGQLDSAAELLLQRLHLLLQGWAAEAAERLGALPLLLQSALRGGPLAPLLRQLLHNDSLMDIGDRRGLFNAVFSLVALLAGSPDLLPLLLQSADSDLLQLPQQAQPAQQAPQREGQAAEAEQAQQAQQAGVTPSGAPTAAPGSRAGRQPSRGRGSAGRTEAGSHVAEGSTPRGGAQQAQQAQQAPSGDSSCWHALQALRLQADVFRRNAEQLAAEGDEDDVQLVGAMLDVLECCHRVQQAVEVWRASTRPDSKEAEGQAGAEAGGSGAQQAQQARQAQQTQQAPDSTELRQQYESSLRPLLFQTVPLQDHYFRNQGGSSGGGLSSHLRRITKEVATLPGQLPLEWESSVLAAMDQDNLAVLRVVIFAPPDTPYANGAFAFDVLLPPEYPDSPPKVQFLTTGGGRVRFNPNLYNTGKVCLSLLGTWPGPSWQPGQSTLLQVLVSIQSMILGTADPYFNEPGYANMEGTKQGQNASRTYNHDIRRHTLQVAILGQLQRPPAGFEEAVGHHFKLKREVVRQQVQQWVREDPSLKKLGADVMAAVDAAAAAPQPH